MTLNNRIIHKIIEIKNKYFFWYIIIFIIFSLIFIKNGFIASSDAASSWFSPYYNSKELLFVWDKYSGIGNYAPNNFTSFILRSYYSFVNIFFKSPDLLQKASWIIFFSFFGSVIFKIIDKYTLKNKLLSFFSLIFLIFNPISQYFIWQKQHWTYYIIVPYFISIFFYYKYAKQNNIKYLIFISLIWFIFGFSFNQPAYFISFLIIVLFLFIHYLIKAKNRYKFILDNIFFGASFILINFVYFSTLIFGGGMEMISNVKQSYANSDPIPILRDLKDVNFFYSFINSTLGYEKYFLDNNIVYIVLYQIFLIILFINPIIHKKNKINNIYLIFLTLLLIFIFLNKGISEPFSEFSKKLYSLNFMYIFRDFKDKIAIGISIITSILFILSFKYRKKITVYFFSFISILCTIIFFSNAWLPKNFYFSDNLNYLNNLKIEDSRINKTLNTPLVNYSFFYTNSPKYSGDNPIKNIIHRDVIYTSNTSDNRIKNIKNTLYTNSIDSDIFYLFLKEFNISYVLNHKNSYVYEDSVYENKLDFSKFKLLEPIKESEKLILYKFKEYYSIINSNNSYFRKKNNTKYNIYLKNITKNKEIFFLDSFNKNWNLYLNQNPTNSWCEKLEEYNNDGNIVTECKHEQKFFEGEELSYLYKKPIFQDSHKLVYDYANGWEIDPEYIKKNFDKSYYKENPDGSIDIELTLYFKPQSYFYLGLIISGTTLTGCITYLIIDGIRNKKKKDDVIELQTNSEDI